MNFPTICNSFAWALCCVFAFLLFSDFIYTEYQLAKEKKKMGVPADEPEKRD